MCSSMYCTSYIKIGTVLKMPVCMYSHYLLYTPLFAHTHTHARTHAHTHSRTHARTHARTRTRTRTRTHYTYVAANTSLLTTFRSDNINGIGSGALAFTYAVPCGLKRSVEQLQPLSLWAPSKKLAETCQKEVTFCNDKRCDMSLVSGLKHIRMY